MVWPVHARPDRLQQLRRTAGGLADGLGVRRGALDDAVARYRAGTEPAFAVNGDDLPVTVGAMAAAVRQLGEWVGQVGDAFAEASAATVLDGVHQVHGGELDELLPPELRVAAMVGVQGGASARRAEPGDDDVDLVEVAVTLGGAPLGRVGRIADAVEAVRAGMDEAARRWAAEPDRPAPERLARAGIDGALNGAGTFGGAVGGTWAGAALCAPTVVGPVPCAVVGGHIGGWVGGRVGELAGDAILGDEPEPWEHDPDALAAAIGDVDADVDEALLPAVEAIAGDAALAADRHVEFVAEHPWLAGDDYADAPPSAAPPPAPVVPRTGPM